MPKSVKIPVGDCQIYAKRIAVISQQLYVTFPFLIGSQWSVFIDILGPIPRTACESQLVIVISNLRFKF